MPYIAQLLAAPTLALLLPPGICLVSFLVRFSPKGPLAQLALHTIFYWALNFITLLMLVLYTCLSPSWFTIHLLSNLLHHTTLLLGYPVTTLGLCEPGSSISCEVLLMDASGVASQTR